LRNNLSSGVNVLEVFRFPNLAVSYAFDGNLGRPVVPMKPVATEFSARIIALLG